MSEAYNETERRQVDRERELRELATGVRLSKVDGRHAEGTTRKYSRAALVPAADDLRAIAVAMGTGPSRAGAKAAGEIWGAFMGEARFRGQPSMRPIYRWLSDQRRTGSSYWDPALDVMAIALGSVFKQLAKAQSGDEAIALTGLLNAIAAEQATSVSLAFIGKVQGRKALKELKDRAARLNTSLPSSVRERLQMKGASDVLLNQFRDQQRRHQDEGDPFKFREAGSSRLATTVVDPYTKTGRLIEVGAGALPEPWEWQVFESASQCSREWFSLALICVGLVIKHTGALDVFKERAGKKTITRVRFKEEVVATIAEDIGQWVQSAYMMEPMVCEPLDGGFLTTKLPKVAGAYRGGQVPMRPLDEDGNRLSPYLRTQAGDTIQWDEVSAAMAGTAFMSPFDSGTLAACRKVYAESNKVDLLAASVLESAARSHVPYLGRGLPIYFPIMMDFRGRTYYRTQPWTPQGSDVAKALLRADVREFNKELTPEVARIMLSSIRGITGGPDEKAPIPRVVTGSDLESAEHLAREIGEKPYQCAALSIREPGQLYQIDGTCNGLQHLSALGLDKEGGREVNLIGHDSTQAGPADIYRRVADRLQRALLNHSAEEWVQRIHNSRLVIDRGFTKRQVMVLPYGGTIHAIIDYTTSAALEQVGTLAEGTWRSHPDYQAFTERELARHPLFKKDMQKLGRMLWDVIQEQLPRATAIMDILAAFAQAAGDSAIQWATRDHDRSLRVIQAKTVMVKQSKRTVGLHLPNAVQNLTMFALQRDKDGNLRDPNRVDKGSNKSSIVPNFVHSHDADHMARVAGEMARRGHPFMSVHDCFFTTRDGLGDLYHITRQTFVDKYHREGNKDHPLALPVSFLRADDSKVHKQDHHWTSWDAAVKDVLGNRAHEQLMEPGELDINEVLDSYFFFC